MPGTQVLERETLPARTAPTDVSTGFLVGFFKKGPSTSAVRCRNMRDVVDTFGDRPTDGQVTAWDSLDVAFREGLNDVYVARRVGPTPVRASYALLDGSAGTVATLRAKEYGAWANAAAGGFEVTVTVVSTNFTVSLLFDGVEVANSGTLADKAALLAWVATLDDVEAVTGASALDPAAVTAADFAGGTDDASNSTTTEATTALALFGPELGPGQVAIPGATTSAIHGAVLDHAYSRNRVALLDGQDTSTVATHTAATDALRDGSTDRKGSYWASWATVPGVVRGTDRTVPWSAVQLGLEAKRDAAGLPPNAPAAGENGQAVYVTGITQEFDQDDIDELAEAGANVPRVVFGGVRAYGYRSLADPDAYAVELPFGTARIVMAIKARAEVIAERFVLKLIDGHGHRLGQFGGELEGMVATYWSDGADSGLFGETPQEAFVVDVGPGVNTPETIEAQEAHAEIAIRPSKGAETVVIGISKAPTNVAL